MQRSLLCATVVILSTLATLAQTPASVTVGNQEWMSKNLDVTTYSNGDPIPQIQDPAAWAAAKSGAWCYIMNSEETNEPCGKMYNGYAIMDIRGLAPKGWRVANAADWKSLFTYMTEQGMLTRHKDIPGTYTNTVSPDPLMADSTFSQFDLSKMGSSVSSSYTFRNPNAKAIKRWLTEDRTMPIKDFFVAASGSNAVGLNFLCCGYREEKGEFKGFSNNYHAIAFLYPASAYQKSDGKFYYNFNASFLKKAPKEVTLDTYAYGGTDPLFVAFGNKANSPQGVYTTTDLVPGNPEHIRDAKYGVKNLGPTNVLGGSAYGFTVRCVKGEQWMKVE